MQTVEMIQLECDACLISFEVEKRFAVNYGHLCQDCSDDMVTALEVLRGGL